MDYAKYVFQELTKAGATVEGACAMLGNLEAESGIIPCRLEGDYTPPYEASRRYADNVDNGIISRQTFISDGKGWGLAQWTYYDKGSNKGRKQALYDYCRARSISIANLEVQTEFLIRELETDYGSVWAAMCNGSSLKSCSDSILIRFENPYDKSEGTKNYRYNLGMKYYNMFKNSSSSDGDEGDMSDPETSDPTSGGTPPEEWVGEKCTPEIRVLTKGTKGKDVAQLQFALLDAGYDLGKTGKYKNGIDRDFGEKTETALKNYQAESNLPSTGICDVDTWQVVFQ